MLLRAQAESYFEEVLARIADDGRGVTAWEGDCLRAALVMMAMDDYGSAKVALQTCEGGPRRLAQAKCTWKIEDFCNCLAMLKGLAGKPAIVLH